LKAKRGEHRQLDSGIKRSHKKKTFLEGSSQQQRGKRRGRPEKKGDEGRERGLEKGSAEGSQCVGNSSCRKEGWGRKKFLKTWWFPSKKE